MSELQFDEKGNLIIPTLIQKDLDDAKEAKAQGMSWKEFRKFKKAAMKEEKKNHRESLIKAAILDHEQIVIEHNVETKKFLDEELVFYHTNGFSDYEIARIFNCNTTSVWQRRCKLALVANFLPPYGLENLTPEELRDRWAAMLQASAERYHQRKHEEAIEALQPLAHISHINLQGGAEHV